MSDNIENNPVVQTTSPTLTGKITWPEAPSVVSAKSAAEMEKFIAAHEYNAASSLIPKTTLEAVSDYNRSELEKIAQASSAIADLDSEISLEESMKQAGFFDSNTVWDDVSNLYSECASMLSSATLISDMLRNKDLMEHVEKRKLLIRNVMSLASDLTSLSEDLTKIRSLHKDHSGAAKSNEDFFLSMQIYTDYVNFIDRYTATAQPTVTWISEMLQTALDLLSKENPELAATISQNVQLRIRAISGILANATGQTVTAAQQEAAVAAAPQATEEVIS